MGLVTPPFVVELKKTSTTREVTKPLSCATTVPYHGIVTNEAWNSFIHYHYGSTTLSHISDALGTATTKDRHSLVSYQTPNIEDCYYRMLKPTEIKLAMAFGADYIVLGSGKDQVKQLGNAVTPPAMRWLVQQVVQSLQ
jgi:DNA (cytosine-5)-methyltransferase 1